MRTISVLLLVLFASSALAQPCEPAQTDEVCPDTTTWQRYIPLDVGNVWQYAGGFPTTSYEFGYEIVDTGTIDGVLHYLVRSCHRVVGGTLRCFGPDAIRYDGSTVIRRYTEHEEPGYYPWLSETACPLNVAFGEAVLGCSDYVVLGQVSGGYGAGYEIGDETFGDTRKTFDDGAQGQEVYVAGLGYVSSVIGDVEEERLVYARVGGRQVGTPAFASCDPADAGDIACPDTTDWRRYLPLEVGNQWQYHVDRFIETDFDFGYEVTGEEVIDGEPHYLVRYCRLSDFGTEFSCSDPVPVRYDEENRGVVRRNQAEDGSISYTKYIVPFCPLDSAFGSDQEADCFELGGIYLSVSGEYGSGVVVGGDVLGDTRKTYNDGLQGYGSVVAGVGYTGYTNVDTDEAETLIYTQLDGVEYGARAFVFPTADEPGAAQPVTTAFTEVFPNPARTSVQAQYALGAPQAVTLELIDLLGRRVRAAELGRQGAGAHDVEIDTAGLRPGLYVLRLRGDAGAKATQRIVVLR